MTDIVAPLTTSVITASVRTLTAQVVTHSFPSVGKPLPPEPTAPVLESAWSSLQSAATATSTKVLPTQPTTISQSSEASTPSSETYSATLSGKVYSDTFSPSIGGGAIAGITICCVLIIALSIGSWHFWRRKKQRTQPPTATLADEELARREGDGDKIVLDPSHTAPTTGAYQTQYQEISGNGLTQELDRSHSYKHAIGGAHELKAEDRPGELPYAGVEQHGSADEHGVVGVNDRRTWGMEETTLVARTDDTAMQALQVSPHVEAQRKREVEWLEAEETRMRQRREALLQQGGGKT